MGAYMQMGHHTENLVGVDDLDDFKGLILSPLNRLPEDLKLDVVKFRSIDNFDLVFDPQLYYPRTVKQKIRQHPYFPDDFDTNDHSSIDWWRQLVSKLTDYAAEIGVSTLITPIVDPRKCTDEFYHTAVEVGNLVFDNKTGSVTTCLLTLIVDVDDLSEEKTLLKIASFASMSKCDGYYVVFKSDIEPRREYASESRLRGMLKFIKELKFLEKPITIAFSSSDMLLFKAAGATNCGTGKFFNLRRFTSSRFEEPAGGGGQLPYWFEHNLMAFLREADLKRIQNSNFSHFIGGLNSDNTWGHAIFDLFVDDPGRAWVALGWRQYLSWFAKTERILDNATDNKDLKDWLKNAEKNWLELNDNDVLMDEPKNDGGWLRPWRQAIAVL
jgi:hypothetical protein